MATLAEIERALQKAQANLVRESPTVVGGNPYGGFRNVPNPAIETLKGKIARLEKAKRVEQTKQVAADPNAPSEDRELAVVELDSLRKASRADLRSFRKNLEQTNKDIGELLGQAIVEETKQKSIEEELDASYGKGLTPETPKAEPAAKAVPAATEVAGPPAPAPPAPTKPAPAPTKENVKGLQKGVGEMKEQRNRMREIELEREEMLLAEEKAAQRQRAYNALTPAQKLELDVRSREQQKAANARGAVEARREQLAADEEYKGMQIASSGSFKQGDVTQYVDPTKREAVQSYFTNRAADIRAGKDPEVRAKGGQFTAGPMPTFGDRSLTVIDVLPEHGGGKGVSTSGNFAGGVKFGSDRDTMVYETIGGKSVPIMTIGDAYATQSRGSGINAYEKTGTPQQQLDAMSADRIRTAENKKKVEQMIEYQITGVLPPEVAKRAEADKKKREAEAAAAAAAAPRQNPSDPSQPYS